ncbi:MAG: hypothetical protein MJ195_02045 [Mycoplasmoidaceae bacterium]|nr:hypothetical protein [Mycoplasmoidaceae bacterium]
MFFSICQPQSIIVNISLGPYLNKVCHIFLSLTLAMTKWLTKIKITPRATNIPDITNVPTNLKFADLNGSRHNLNVPYHTKYPAAKSPAFLCLINSKPK